MLFFITLMEAIADIMNTFLIQFSFFVVTKILVTAGSNSLSSTKTEIVNLENEVLTCQDLGNYPLAIYGGFGSNIGSSVVICGGHFWNESATSWSDSNRCYKLVAGEWQQFTTMTSRRAYAASMVVGNSLMTFGGIGYGTLQSTELIHADGQVSQGPNMPTALQRHAIANVNASTLIISGGNKNYWDYASPLTWYYNHVTQKFQEGPSLLEGRYNHASGTVVDQETSEKIVVVIGGDPGGQGDDENIDSTELLINGEWQQGKNMSNKKEMFSNFVCAFFSDTKLLFLYHYFIFVTFQVRRCQKNL